MLRTLLISMFMSSAALADTWTVDDDGKADFDNIQAAIDVASDGDEILVYPGIYTGTDANSNVIRYLNKNIAIESTDGAAVTIIDGENLRRAVQCFASGSLNGFTLTNGYHTGRGGGLSVGGPNSPTISNCLIQFNTSPDGGGVSVRNQSTPSFLNCTIVNNTANQGGGVYIVSPGVAAFMGCSIQDNTADYGGGIFNDATTITISGSTVCSNTPDQLNGSYQDGGGNCVSEICDSDSDGVYDCIDQCPGEDDIDSDGDGVMDCIDGCPDDPNKSDPGQCGCDEVDTDTDNDGVADCVDDCPDWPGACSSDGQTIYVIAGESIQAAIDVAPVGGVVSLLASFYQQSEINLHGKAMTLIGLDTGWGDSPGESAGTVITPAVTGSGPVLVCDSGETSATVFENLAISSGYAEKGGGIFIQGSSPTITNCSFGYNSARWGGAVANEAGGSPTFSNCLFMHNTSEDQGGAIINMGATTSMTLNTCNFYENGDEMCDSGGAIHSGYEATTILNDCRITHNTASSAGAIYSVSASTLELTNTRICDNGPGPIDGDYVDGGGNCISEFCDSDSDGVDDCIDQCPGEDDVDSDGDGVADCLDQCPGEPDIDTDEDGVADCLDQCPGEADIDSDGDGIMDCVDACPDWPGDCSSDGQTIYVIAGESIQAAIDVAPVGGVVSLLASFYQQSEINLHGKAMTLIGLDTGWGDSPGESAGTVITPAVTGSGPVLVCDSGETSATVFENLAISSGYAEKGGGIFIQGSSPTITNCSFGYNSARWGGAVANEAGGSPTFSNCLFMHNTSEDQGGAIINMGATTSMTLNTCNFYENGDEMCDSGGAIHSGYEATTILNDCRITHNTASSAGAIYSVSASTLELTNTRICDNGPGPIDGDYVDGGGNCISEFCDSDSDGVDDCIDQCPGEDDVDSDGDGVADCLDQCPGEPDIDTDEDGVADCLDQCPGEADIDSDGDGIMDCVDACPDWPGDCSSDGQTIYVIAGESIQAAIDVAPVGGVVSLLASFYQQSEINLHGKAMTLIGLDTGWGDSPGESAGTVITPAVTGSGPVLVCDSGETSATVFENLAISSGYAEKGGGIFIQGSSPTITNCSFGYNSARWGGAVANEAGGSPTFSNCLFMHNTSEDQGGAIINMGATTSMTLNTCNFYENGDEMCDSGGAIHSGYEATTILNDCRITHNTASSAGAIYSVSASTLELTNTRICDNGPGPIDGDYVDGGGNCISEFCDSDSDGVDDCIDQCPGEDDVDSDGDGVADCLDQCPGEPDIDTDEDGVADCLDQCPGEADIDSDGDGIMDCVDACPDWPGDCSSDGQTIYVIAGESIQAAIDVAPVGGVVSLLASFYQQSEINLHGKAMTLIGLDTGWGDSPGESAGTVITPAVTGSGPVLVCDSGETSATVFENLAISSGYAEKGGGIFIQGSSPTITNCSFGYNSARWGGAVANEAGGSPTFSNCLFMHNTSEDQGGAIINMGATTSMTLNTCNFYENGDEMCDSGGAIHSGYEATTILNDCRITHNTASSAGAIYSVSASTLELTNTRICDNGPGPIDGDYVDGGGNCISEFCDSDSDGVDDCIDQCPGEADIDTDEDGVADCLDQCPDDPNKIYPDVCGCGVPDEDVDENGIIDCLEPDCVADFDDDGDVDVLDLLDLIAAWGVCPTTCAADFDDDGDVDVLDLLHLIGAWGVCP